MKIKIIASCPEPGQDGIEFLIGKVFEIVPYNEFDSETRKEMKDKKEVAIRINNDIRQQYIINKNEYKIIG